MKESAILTGCHKRAQNRGHAGEVKTFEAARSGPRYSINA